MRTQAAPASDQPLPADEEPPPFHDLLARLTDAEPQTNPADDDPLAFTPVPTASTRHDGWTPERQARFLQALAVMGVVSRAPRAVGMSKQSAHALRHRPGAETFAAAWDCALAMGRDRAFAIAMDRAENGVVAPRFYKGQQIGTVRRFDYRLALAAIDGLRALRPAPSREAWMNGVSGKLVKFAADMRAIYGNLVKFGRTPRHVTHSFGAIACLVLTSSPPLPCSRRRQPPRSARACGGSPICRARRRSTGG